MGAREVEIITTNVDDIGNEQTRQAIAERLKDESGFGDDTGDTSDTRWRMGNGRVHFIQRRRRKKALRKTRRRGNGGKRPEGSRRGVSRNQKGTYRNLQDI